jgi:CheY-like chemotaxis protein
MAAILVVDDEPLIREMLMLVLERGGFTVLCAGNGVQALHKYHLYRDDIELVISDVSMPEMGGESLAMRLLAERPDLPVILLSDQCDSIDMTPHPNLRLLPKPFDLATLLSTVRSLVAEGRSLSTP